MKKQPQEYEAYALMYSGRYSGGFCTISTTRYDNSLAIFLHKWEAEERRKEWGRLKPKIVKVKIVVG